jgi:nuclear pore complex protein Nup133
LGSALKFRESKAGVYGLELPMLEAWTSSRPMIALVSTLFNTTAEKVDTSGSQTSSNEEPHSQLPELASILFACYQERLDYLIS